jgi:hypothetical protein
MTSIRFPLNYSPSRRLNIVAQSGSGRLILYQPETQLYFALDEIGILVWGLCDGTHTISEIINRLYSQYEASVEVIQTDVMELMSEFLANKLLLTKAK